MIMTTPEPPSATTKSGYLPVGFHSGNVITYLASHYSTIVQVVKEIAQNQIDAQAKRGQIIINAKRMILKAYDDGRGASVEEMRDRISQIGARKKGPEDIGEKGIGNLAPIAIGWQYRLITRARDASPKTLFFRLRLDRDAIDGQAEVNFEYEELPLGFSFSGTEENMSTFVDVQRIEPSALRGLMRESDPAQFLADAVAEAYSTKIRKSGIDIQITVVDKNGLTKVATVKPIQFPGRRETIEIETPQGPVKFEMFLARSPAKKPTVSVVHQKRFSFLLSGIGTIWDEVADFFGSGHIQGNIEVGFCSLKADRIGFELNSDLEHFHRAVIEFVETYGRPWIARLREQFKAERLSELAGRVLQNLERSLAGKFPELLEQFRGVGFNPTPPPTGGSKVKTPRPPKKKPDGDVPRLKPPPPESPLKPEVENKKLVAKNPSPPPKIKKGVEDDQTQKKVRVAGQSGLVVLFREGDETTGSKWRIRLGEKGEEKNCLIFNIAHADFTAAEQKGDMALRQYMSYLMVVMLVKPLMTDEEARVFHSASENVMLQFLDAFLIRPGT